MNHEEQIVFLTSRIQNLEDMLAKSMDMNTKLMAKLSTPQYHSYPIGTTEIRIDQDGNFGIGTIK